MDGVVGVVRVFKTKTNQQEQEQLYPLLDHAAARLVKRMTPDLLKKVILQQSTTKCLTHSTQKRICQIHYELSITIVSNELKKSATIIVSYVGKKNPKNMQTFKPYFLEGNNGKNVFKGLSYLDHLLVAEPGPVVHE